MTRAVRRPREGGCPLSGDPGRCGESNFGVVQKHIESLSSPKAETPKEKKEAGTIQIDALNIADVRVALSLPDMGKAEDIRIEKIAMSGLKGTPQQVGKQVLGQLVKQIIGEVSVNSLEEVFHYQYRPVK